MVHYANIVKHVIKKKNCIECIECAVHSTLSKNYTCAEQVYNKYSYIKCLSNTLSYFLSFLIFCSNFVLLDNLNSF